MGYAQVRKPMVGDRVSIPLFDSRIQGEVTSLLSLQFGVIEDDTDVPWLCMYTQDWQHVEGKG
jgi:hypothetical protein